MAFVQGNASDWQDLWTKFLNFLTTNSTLVAEGQNWTSVWSASDGKERLLVGPGLANEDEVYVAMKLDSLPAADAYWIDFSGCTGLLETAQNFTSHINPQPFVSRLYLDTAPMHYWFIASGRRFMIVLKISTVFQTVYAGLYLPFGPPTAYAYPLIVGGSAGLYGAAHISARNWRSTNQGLSNFWDSFANGSGEQQPSTWLLNPSGEWKSVVGGGSILGDFSFGPLDTRRDELPIGRDYSEESRFEEPIVAAQMRAGFGGIYPLLPLTLYSNGVQKMSYGLLDGCFKCQGENNASENTITQDGFSHLVVQNCFRTDISQYAAFALR